MTILATSSEARAVTIPDPAADVIRLPGGSGRGIGIITVVHADGIQSAAIRYVEDQAVPPGVMAIGVDLAADLEISRGDVDRWEVETVSPQLLRRLTLEAATERPPGDVARELEHEPLVGRVLLIDPGQDTWLTIGETPYRVHSAEPAANGPVQISDQTDLDLFVPGVRSGVDLVILADCSGSMGVEDLPVGEWATRSRGSHMKRSEALHFALEDLLAMRLRTEGRISRIAIVEFTHETAIRFPRAGGMVELDGSSNAELIDEFRAAVNLLLPKQAGTNIGNALVEAADLLYKFGHPGNEKVIVLVSDGAHWQPAGDQATGEFVVASEEPVSLMEHLNRDGRLRLHAIGISNAHYYQAWLGRGGRPHVSLEPNHELLQALIRAGAGDPATIGGLDVLSEYFTGLGKGVVNRLPRARMRVRFAPLSADAQRILEQASEPADASGWKDSVIALSSVAGECNELAAAALGMPVFDRRALSRNPSRVLAMGAPTSNDSLSAMLVLLVGSVAVIPDLATHSQAEAHVRLHGNLVQAVRPLQVDRLSRLTGATGDAQAHTLTAVARALETSVRNLASKLAEVRPGPPPTAHISDMGPATNETQPTAVAPDEGREGDARSTTRTEQSTTFRYIE